MFALAFSLSAIAQKQQASPYSFFGIGNEFPSKTVEESQMGGVGAAFSDPVHLSFSNPASLTGLRFTTYSIGGLNSQTTVSDGSNTQKSSVFSLSYLALGFPVGKKIGVSGGLRVKSGVGYDLTEGEISDPDGQYVYDGFGGVNSLFFGAGYKLFNGFSIGIETAFNFGTLKNRITQTQEDLQYQIRLKTESAISGFDAKFGMHYYKKTSTKHGLNAGVVFLKSKNLTVDENSVLYNGFFNEDSESVKSVLELAKTSGLVKKPLNTILSVGYGEFSKWQASLEYSFNNAMSFSGTALANNTENVTYTKYQRLSFGGYYIPKFNSLTSYFSRVIYRAGLRYVNEGMSIDGTEVKDFGITFGVGLPIGRGLSDLNIGFEYGKRGEIVSKLVEEKYFNLKVGLSLGDKWFRKRKID